MPVVSLAPSAVQQFIAADGSPAIGYQLFSYRTSTDTKAPTYTTAAGDVPHTNPIVLDALGEAEIWLDTSVVYRLLLAPPTDTDPPQSAIWTVDGVAAALTVTSAANINLSNVDCSGLPQAPDDDVASGLGVAIGGLYLNGNVLQVRLS